MFRTIKLIMKDHSYLYDSAALAVFFSAVAAYGALALSVSLLAFAEYAPVVLSVFPAAFIEYAPAPAEYSAHSPSILPVCAPRLFYSSQYLSSVRLPSRKSFKWHSLQREQ